ncbi:MAG: NAD(P)H-binding protein [Myxococcales bacterium]|jgi:nucleoside-diphosphate-sugar epimerase
MRALVIGASGGFGGHVGRELAARGHEVWALQRPGGRRPAIDGATRIEGDALDLDAVRRAARGMDAIVFGFHVPFPQWDPTAIEATRVTATVAAETSATVLFPGNVFGLGPDFAEPLAEDCGREAVCRKGHLRNRMEDILQDATRRGARAIVLRAGDYIAAGVDNNWLGEMARRALQGGPIVDPGEPGVPHCWAYLPDVARAGVDLLERRADLAPFEVVHFEGYTVTQDVIIAAIRHTLGDPRRRVTKLPWFLLPIAGVISPLMRELREMRYLWTEPVRLDGGKLRRLLPGFQVTPLQAAVDAALGARASAPRTATAVRAA